jgi:hypothetical protein
MKDQSLIVKFYNFINELGFSYSLERFYFSSKILNFNFSIIFIGFICLILLILNKIDKKNFNNMSSFLSKFYKFDLVEIKILITTIFAIFFYLIDIILNFFLFFILGELFLATTQLLMLYICCRKIFR